jgi:magnesium chelatase family protein
MVLACLQSAAVLGVEAHLVSVEVDVSFGLPQFNMVGLPDATVRESRDRVRAAIKNSGFEFPPHRITVNLAPADLRKAGSSFDLSIAIGLLAAGAVVTRRAIDDTIVLGELSLDGGIHAVRGVLAVAAAARRLGVSRLLLPPQNAPEACVIDGLDVCAVRSLQEAVAALNAPEAVSLIACDRLEPVRTDEPDLSEVRGQIVARRAIEVAAAGGHNLLMTGSPGSGKTMLARRMASVLPDMTLDEAIECTQIHSVAGQLAAGVGLLASRPFRAPHHTVSNVALVGGGSIPRPGEISLAHQGVLFLDELPEFERRVLDALRQPIEEGRVAIARAAAHVVFPCRFMLVAAMNPCPCGYAGSDRKPCRCTPPQVSAYASRVSGPLRDRFDLSIVVPQVPVDALSEGGASESSAAVRHRVVRAREVQRERAAGTKAVTNALLRGPVLLRHCRPDARGAARLARAVEMFALSARGYHRVMRVARTIADLEGAAAVGDAHVAEALQFRGT